MTIRPLRSLTILFWMLMLICFAFSTALLAQGPNRGPVNGTVTDGSGSVLQGVSLTLSGPALPSEQVSITNGQGELRFPVLSTGRYKLVHQINSFDTMVRDSLSIGSVVSVTMTPTSQQETVVVQITGDQFMRLPAPTIDKMAGPAASVVGAAQLAPPSTTLDLDEPRFVLAQVTIIGDSITDTFVHLSERDEIRVELLRREDLDAFNALMFPIVNPSIDDLAASPADSHRLGGIFIDDEKPPSDSVLIHLDSPAREPFSCNSSPHLTPLTRTVHFNAYPSVSLIGQLLSRSTPATHHGTTLMASHQPVPSVTDWISKGVVGKERKCSMNT